MIRWRLGGFFGCLLALTLAFGCESQVGKDYTGEPLLTLHGKVLLSDEEADQNLEPRVMYLGVDGDAVLARGELSGDFPARFRFDLTEPPPESAIHALSHRDYDYDGEIAEGWLVLVPPDFPSKLPYATRTESFPEQLPTRRQRVRGDGTALHRRRSLQRTRPRVQLRAM